MSEPNDAAGPWTIARLLAWTTEFFSRRELESPRLCAELLLAHALGCQRLELYTRHEQVPPQGALASFREAVREAASGRPIAYLTGFKEFFSLAFEVTPAVLIPRPETEVLVERTIALIRSTDPRLRRVLDLGTGSGCIAVSLARHLPGAQVFASDISAAALDVARRNAERHGLLDRIEFREGDLLACWQDVEPFDVIVSNPPYIGTREADELPASVREYEPHAALYAGEDGLAVLRRIAAEAPSRLVAGGHLLTEVGYRQSAAVRALLDEAGWRDIVTYRDDLRHERVVHARSGGTHPVRRCEP
jgi:release factor glutamine methyltransferase